MPGKMIPVKGRVPKVAATKPKNSQVSDEEIMPKKFPKPKGNRLRMLEEINRMNEAQITRNIPIKKKKPATGGR
jgi:hypothetical protein